MEKYKFLRLTEYKDISTPGLLKQREKLNPEVFVYLNQGMLSLFYNEHEEEVKLFEKIANRTLQTPDTWEVALSTGKDKKETWTRLITEHKLGGLAMLRNLSNMKKAEVDKKVIYKLF